MVFFYDSKRTYPAKMFTASIGFVKGGWAVKLSLLTYLDLVCPTPFGTLGVKHKALIVDHRNKKLCYKSLDKVYITYSEHEVKANSVKKNYIQSMKSKPIL